METWILLLIIAAVVIGAVIYLKSRKAPEQLEEGSKPKQIESKKPETTAADKKPVRKEPDKKAAEAVPKEQPKPKTESVKPAPEEKKPEAPVEKKEEVVAEPKAEPEPEPVAPTPEPSPEPPPLVAEKMAEPVETKHTRDVAALRKGLGKARAKEGFFGRLAKLITGRQEIDPAIVDELQDVLVSSDVGVQTAETILERIRTGLSKKELNDSGAVWAALRGEASRILNAGPGGLVLRTRPTVVLMVGVNGSGKTTTIGKLATQLKASGRKVVLAAGDTFRAAAVQQLEVWGKRVGCEVVKGKDGADPAAVIFEAIQKASSSGADVVLADTAGRLHTKVPLMDELKKVSRTMAKAMEGAPHEVLLVIDATTGQNAMAQSRQFAEALQLTGIVLTKLDGTAKGGVVLGICDEMKLPVRYIGLGERPDDLRPFEADEFVEALLGEAQAEEDAA
ncbi:MAG: signal recognition particle-docking protein FtsY [Deltaproteobacteria bacterium]|nr:signal recognition particle-docking protein FtsY [Deltaproteobacteria bacterium]